MPKIVAEVTSSGDTVRKSEWQPVSDGRKDDGRIPFIPSRPKKPLHFADMHKKTKVAQKAHPKLPEQPPAVNTSQTFSGAEYVRSGEYQDRPPSLSPASAQPNNFFVDRDRASYAASSANESVSSDAGQIELLRVERLILQAGYDFPDLRGRPGDTAEDAVARLLDQYSKLNTTLRDSHTRLANSRSMDDELRSMQKELRACKSTLNEKQMRLSDAEAMLRSIRKKHEKEMNESKSTIKGLEQQMNSSAEEISRLQERQRVLVSDQAASTNDREKEIDVFNRQIASLQFQTRELEASHANRLRKERELFERELSKIKKEHESQLNIERNETTVKVRNEQLLHRKSLDNLHEQLNEERAKSAKCMSASEVAEARLKEQERKVQTQLQEQKDIFDVAIESERKKFDGVMQEYQEHIVHLQEQLRAASKTQEERSADEQRRLEKELRKQEESLRGQHEAEQYQLRSAVEDFKVAIVTKEHFKGITDAELTLRFNKLAQDVEDFARLEWDPVREAEWWKQQLQQLHPRNTRKLKQKIVQNSLWISLREQVFHSPFRLFAEEGAWKELDKEWADIYGLATLPAQWPEISRETEKSRYKHAQQLRAAIDLAVKAGTQDRLGQLKLVYERLVASSVNAIAQNIEKVATIKEKDRKALHKIFRLAAELWLECCSQRYRLIVTLAGGIEDVLGLSQGNIRLVKLALKPELRRFGNAHGDNVAKEEPVAGWRSDVEIYPSQRVVSVEIYPSQRAVSG